MQSVLRHSVRLPQTTRWQHRLYAKSMGLDCTCLLLPSKPHTERAARSQYAPCRTKQSWCASVAIAKNKSARCVDIFETASIWVIPAGGSSWLGVVGFVNGALELAEQIASGEVSAPRPPVRSKRHDGHGGGHRARAGSCRAANRSSRG